MSNQPTTTRDVYQRVTDQIVTAIETGAAKQGDWRMPWHCAAQGGKQINAESRRAYSGINRAITTMLAHMNGWPNEWCTYKGWQNVGAQVRKGEHGTLIVFWKFTERHAKGPNGETIIGDDGKPKVETYPMAGVTPYSTRRKSKGTKSRKAGCTYTVPGAVDFACREKFRSTLPAWHSRPSSPAPRPRRSRSIISIVLRSTDSPRISGPCR